MTAQTSIRDMFFEEAEELLEALAEGLSAMHGGSQDDETVNAVFRAVHSIKGGAGAFKLSALVAFAHRFETVLDEVRSHRLEVDGELMHTLQRSADHLADLVEDARTGSDRFGAQTPDFLVALDACLGGTPEEIGTDEEDGSFNFAALSIDLGDLAGDDPDDLPGPEPTASMASHQFTITLWPHAALFANGHDPALLIAALADLGEVETTPDLSRLPGLNDFHPGRPSLGWEIRLTSDAEISAVQEVFEFVEGLCDLTIQANQPAEDPAEPVQIAPDEVVPNTAAAAPTARTQPASAPPADRDNSADVAAQAEKSGPKPTLRVDLDRVDRLINAVGELIINQSMIAQRVQELRLAADADVVIHVEDYRLLARDIQEAVMAIRAQPVKPLFQRMSRIVRDAADATSKSARLVTAGEAAEVDKTVVERLSDPLTHMIRNAIDHGLELPEARLAAGKDPTGSIYLSAAHRSGAVVITVRDDGAGLNRPKILEIARRKNLVPADAELTDPEIDALLFMPGFSTASTVSNLSGRGVGLDVVKSSVTALGGRVSIASTPGQGTEFTITLPLTLAVLDGMLVSVAGQIMVVPITAVHETIRPGMHDLHTVGPDDRLLSIRGKFIPMVDVAEGLGFARPEGTREPQTLLLVETEDQGQCALIVDRVHDQRQVVIKGLESNYGAVPGVSAATVLGDGQIALILDPDAIANHRVRPAFDARPTQKPTEGKAHVLA